MEPFTEPDKYYRHEIILAPEDGGIWIYTEWPHKKILIKLTTMEQVIVTLLYTSIPSIVNHEGMLFQVYGDNEPDCAVNAIQVHVHKINKKLRHTKWTIAKVKGIGRVLRRRV
jgi:DNA-binding response OmpR family regulator